MKQKWVIIMGMLLLLMGGGLSFILINSRVPNIVGFFGSENDNQMMQVSFDRESKYVLYLDGNEYDTGEYENSTNNAYILDSNNNNDGIIILTNTQTYLVIPTLQSAPFLLNKISDVPTYIDAS